MTLAHFSFFPLFPPHLLSQFDPLFSWLQYEVVVFVARVALSALLGGFQRVLVYLLLFRLAVFVQRQVLL